MELEIRSITEITERRSNLIQKRIFTMEVVKVVDWLALLHSREKEGKKEKGREGKGREGKGRR